jgi:uncharacterized RDD family membrane protein YckC
MISPNPNLPDVDNLELASFGSRVKAFIIDDILITVLFAVLYWEKLSNYSTELTDVLVVMNESVLQILLMKFIYQSFFVWYYGATVGKLVAKIRVIDYNHFGRVSLLNSVIRSFFRILSEMFFYIGFVLAFFNDSRQTLQDRVGRTLVVNA